MPSRRLKIGSPIPHKKSRIEIIPLIDIMFFLLASFMMVSLQMSKTENVRVDLPEASQAKADFQPGMINIAVDKEGRTYFEKEEVDAIQLSTIISNRFRLETNTPVTISGDLATEHGSMVEVYELVRGVGVQKISFCVTPGTPEPGAQTP
jgi:biopolymer transport protein ExbD